MLLSELASVSRRVAGTGSRRAKVAALADCLRRLSGPEVRIGVSYLAGRLPQGSLGIGPAAIRAAFPESSATEAALQLRTVDAGLEAIARASGSGSAAARRERLHALFASATREEQEFLLRLLSSALRQGALEGVMTEAVAQAAQLPLSDIRRAVTVAGDAAAVAQAVLERGADALAHFAVRLLQPVKPMLAQTAASVEEALQRLGTAELEYKVDGARVQVHKAGAEVRVYTRSLKDISAAVPEIVEAARALTVRDIILDGEGLALLADGTPQPFQVTMRRIGRRRGVAQSRAELPLSVYFFDCLYLEGEDLTARPGAERLEALTGALPPALLIPRRITADPASARLFLEEALEHGHEGVMAKSLTAPYEAGSRGSAWLKIKSAHTLDLVVLAAEWGSGRRSTWLSNLHLGARDPEGGGYVMLGKTFKGMTDEMLAWQTQRLQELAVARSGNTVQVRPELVVEVAFNDVQASPQYPGGVALRFARVKRYRPDKRAEEADTIASVRALRGGEGVS